MDALGHRRFTVVGCDTGMDIAYALAADHRDRGDRLAVAEAVLPGVQPSPPLPGDVVRVCIGNLADSLLSLRGSFGFYQALDTTSAQNQQRAKKKLTLPVLAVGEAESGGTGPGNGMKLAADNVQTVVLPDCGHFVAEEAPQEMLAALTAFLIP
jgi:pimeloyl-ACP methyl ester carboxylesterase